eukprot:1074485-Pyramimonas_sp.AAC.1
MAGREDYDALPLPPRATSGEVVVVPSLARPGVRLPSHGTLGQPSPLRSLEKSMLLWLCRSTFCGKQRFFIVSGLPPAPPKNPAVLVCAACGGYACEA